MKIVLISSSYPPVLGGLQEAVSWLAREFWAAGHEVQVVANRYPRRLKRQEEIDDIPVTRILFPGFYLHSLRPKRLAKYLAGLLLSPLSALRLLLFMRRLRPDIVNIHFLGSQAPFAVFAAKLSGIKVVVSLHGDDVEGLPHRSGIDRFLFRKVLAAADHVTACSDYLLREALKLEPSVQGRATAIHNGVREEDFDEVPPHRHRAAYIFAAGRLVRKKGFDLLLDAYRRTLDRGLPDHLILAGDGPERESLLEQAKQLRLSVQLRGTGMQPEARKQGEPGSVLFWGRAARGEMISLLKGAELVVIPSRRESFGIIALEALAARKRIVAARTGGLPEILEGQPAARLVDAEDPEMLADALLAGPGEPIDSAPAASGLRSWQTTAAQYCQIYRRVLS